MIRIDDSLLEELGLLVLPKEERDKLLKQIYDTLEMRVGMRLAERMTDQQLDEFEKFIDTNDEAGALKWLETNFPDYKQVVADELEKLKSEIKKDSTQIVAAMQGAGDVAQPTATVAPVPEPSVPPVTPQSEPTSFQAPAEVPQQMPPAMPTDFGTPVQSPITQPQDEDQNQQTPFAA